MFQVEKKGWTIFFQNRDILLYIHAC
jgi:hypothetical protein